VSLRQDSNLRRTVQEAARGSVRTLVVAREDAQRGKAWQSVSLLVLGEATEEATVSLPVDASRGWMILPDGGRWKTGPGRRSVIIKERLGERARSWNRP